MVRKPSLQQEHKHNIFTGVYCRSFSTSLYWDKPSQDTSKERAKTAGCGSGNRCGKDPYGSKYQCDEFPFRSVTRDDGAKPVNRCVPAEQNRGTDILKLGRVPHTDTTVCSSKQCPQAVLLLPRTIQSRGSRRKPGIIQAVLRQHGRAQIL